MTILVMTILGHMAPSPTMGIQKILMLLHHSQPILQLMAFFIGYLHPTQPHQDIIISVMIMLTVIMPSDIPDRDADTLLVDIFLAVKQPCTPTSPGHASHGHISYGHASAMVPLVDTIKKAENVEANFVHGHTTHNPWYFATTSHMATTALAIPGHTVVFFPQNPPLICFQERYTSNILHKILLAAMPITHDICMGMSQMDTHSP
jgi:hypothetical protein